MAGKEKLVTGIKLGVVMVIGSLIVSKACEKGIEYYRERMAQREELILEEESL